MSKLFRLLLIAIVFVALATMPVTNAVAGDLAVHADDRVEDFKSKAFFVALDGDGDMEMIAEAGPLKLFALCEVNRAAFGDDRISVIVTSDEDGWFEEDASDCCGDVAPLTAGTQITVFSENNVTTGDREYDNDIDEFSAMGPDDDGKLFYISTDGEILGLGLNIFGHDCIVSGVVNLIEFEDDDEDDDDDDD